MEDDQSIAEIGVEVIHVRFDTETVDEVSVGLLFSSFFDHRACVGHLFSGKIQRGIRVEQIGDETEVTRSSNAEETHRSCDVREVQSGISFDHVFRRDMGSSFDLIRFLQHEFCSATQIALLNRQEPQLLMCRVGARDRFHLERIECQCWFRVRRCDDIQQVCVGFRVLDRHEYALSIDQRTNEGSYFDVTTEVRDHFAFVRRTLKLIVEPAEKQLFG